jgi:hypothetical protein
MRNYAKVYSSNLNKCIYSLCTIYLLILTEPKLVATWITKPWERRKKRTRERDEWERRKRKGGIMTIYGVSRENQKRYWSVLILYKKDVEIQVCL